MSEKILVTGGAGFIGSHLVDGLLEAGHEVRVFDNLEPQVHGALRENQKKPDYLNPEAEFILGDIRDLNHLTKALDGVDVVFHEAALVGVGQSMYDIERYTSANSYGVSVLLQAIVNSKQRPRKLIVASSMSIYGEGTYSCPLHGPVFPHLRETAQLAERDWEPHCTVVGCTEHVTPCSTEENKPLYPTSIYAINKRDHEEMCLAIGRAYNIPVVALRYFNTYGPRQALSNPYTGVAAIFSNRLLHHHPLVLYEDGKQSRDFVHVKDVVQANLRVMNEDRANYGVFNVGTGFSISIENVARTLIFCFQQIFKGASLHPENLFELIQITQNFRAGDIRHCFPDIECLKALGYRPKITFEQGIIDLIYWIIQQSSTDDFDQARQELVHRGLTL